jgi:SAM-dependent methyltransferase
MAAMNLRTLGSLIRSGQVPFLVALMRELPRYYRLAFLGAALSNGLLQRLAAGPVPLDVLSAEFKVAPSMREGLEAWLQLGVALGELRASSEGYALRGRLSRNLCDTSNDAAAAFVQEVVMIHHLLITQSLERLRQGRCFTLADQDGRLVARASRLAEPFICEAQDEVIPRRGPVRLFEIGCGAAAYIRHAAARNPQLTALGLELQPAVADLALANISGWNLGSRVVIETGDVLQKSPKRAFDVATLHQNIYYFPVERRVSVLRHVRGFLRPGGRLLLTTYCKGRGLGAGLLNLWGATTEGCGRLPTTAEMAAQLGEAGFLQITRRSLIPGESLHAFVGTTSGED